MYDAVCTVHTAIFLTSGLTQITDISARFVCVVAPPGTSVLFFYRESTVLDPGRELASLRTLAHALSSSSTRRGRLVSLSILSTVWLRCSLRTRSQPTVERKPYDAFASTSCSILG